MSRIRVSIVIPTLNSAEALDSCLDSIKQNNTKHEYEVIIVDSGSLDGTVEIARNYANTVLDGMPSRINRNKGIDNAKGDIICFTDSDCVVPKDWIDKLVEGLLRLNGKDSSIIGVGGSNVPLLDNLSLTELAIAKVMVSPLVAYRAWSAAIYQDEREINHTSMMNSAYFKRVIEEVGGFREEPGYPEDVDFIAKIIGKGYKLYYLPEPLVYHKHKSSFGEFAKQMRDFGRKRFKVNRVHKNISRFYHYGPLFLCLMLYSPFFFIPLAMAVANALYESLKERSFRLFIPVTRLTVSFYRHYGGGEIEVFLKGK